MTAYFITGTDTGVGKTWATLALMRQMQRRGLTVVGMKPVAAGCRLRQGQWQNEDALLLQAYGSKWLDYSDINPYAFQQPVSPHLACGELSVDPIRLRQRFDVMRRQADTVLVEGAGGWLSPLDRQLNNADLAVVFELPVILVVGIKLGCINHACLTLQSIVHCGAVCAGWVAVATEANLPELFGIVEYLQRRLSVPLLGLLPNQQVMDLEALADELSTI